MTSIIIIKLCKWAENVHNSKTNQIVSMGESSGSFDTFLLLIEYKITNKHETYNWTSQGPP